jgi:anti-sigma B factor antagonist
MDSGEPERIPPPPRGPEPGSVEVETCAPGAIVVTLRGEHDLNTRGAFSDALESAGGEADVLVDLSACSFIDSTMIGALVLAFQTRSERGHRIELTIPAAAHAIQRVAKVAGLTTFMTIHETREEGLASIRGA